MTAFLLIAVLAADTRPTSDEVAEAVNRSYAKYAAEHPQKSLPEFQADLQARIDELTLDVEHAKKTNYSQEARRYAGLLLVAKRELTASKKATFRVPVVERRLSDFDPARCKIGDLGFFKTNVEQDSGWIWNAECLRVLSKESMIVRFHGHRPGKRTGGADMSTDQDFIVEGLPTKGMSPGKQLAISENLIYANHVDSPVPAERRRIYEVFDPDKPFK